MEHTGELKYPDRIVGIDASTVSTGRGRDRIAQFCKERSLALQPEIKVHDLENVPVELFHQLLARGKNTLHLMYNILDVSSFDIVKFATCLQKNMRGNHLFICISPTESVGVGRITAFRRLMSHASQKNFTIQDSVLGSKVYSYINNSWGTMSCKLSGTKLYIVA